MSISYTHETRPVPWSRSVRGDRSARRLKQNKYIADLAMMLKVAADGESYDGPVSVYLDFDFKNAKTEIVITSSIMPNLRIKRPDVDNLAKMVLEAIEKSGIVKDDAQVAYLRAEKVE